MAVPAGFFVFFGFFAVFFLSVFLVAAYALSKLLTAGRMTTAPKPAIIAERISFFTWQLHFSNAGRRSIRYYQHAIRKSTEGFQYLSCHRSGRNGRALVRTPGSVAVSGAMTIKAIVQWWRSLGKKRRGGVTGTLATTRCAEQHMCYAAQKSPDPQRPRRC